MEAHRLNASSLWSVLDYQYHSPLLSSSIRRDRQQSHHVIPQHVVEIGFVGDLGLYQDHEAKASDLYRTDGLCKPEPPSVLDVEGPDE